jgi:hypothetical protein
LFTIASNRDPKGPHSQRRIFELDGAFLGQPTPCFVRHDRTNRTENFLPGERPGRDIARDASSICHPDWRTALEA